MGVTEQLARWAVETPGETFDGAIRESAKLRFLDTIGISIAGSREDSTLIALKTARYLGGTGRASIIGHPDKLSSPLAAYVNGTAAHSQEYDDYTKGVTHVSVVLVPASLAIAEDLAISGRGMLDGFIVGFELESRIARGLRPALINRGWHTIGVLGSVGAAVAAARMMELDILATRMALGIGASEGQGLRKNVGSMGKAFHAGNAGRSGIFAALLAQGGYQVDPDIIEPGDSAFDGHQRFGFAEAFCGTGNYNLGRMVEDAGTWELAKDTTIVCFHPGGTAPASTIDAVLDLALEHDIAPESIEEILLECTQPALAIGACYLDASDPYQARYCLPWSAAVALIDRQAGLAQYTQARIDRGDVQPLMKRVRMVVPPDFANQSGEWGDGGANWGETRVTARLKDGRVLTKARSYARGWSEEPATWDDVAEKYRECCEGILSNAHCEETIAMIRELDRLGNVRELMDALRVG